MSDDFVFDGHIVFPPLGTDKKLGLKRGLAAENATYVGRDKEVTFTKDDMALHVHDGKTPGGRLHFRLSET
ncbi:hypothetical protein [Tardiphaga robiniae]|uniref:hyaluronate lyase N-terminal domain-containing protein n=1 Tax=Tardiphaga robiniae TaxID=943830 RepID=UPI001585E720|nr:hypothetical protein [Tardiphaga robiniae]NUU41414.1 hypothetical protein [Tardiphaga robiniae]